MRILHVSSELSPYSKTGGLGDVMGALPRAQAAHPGDEVVVVAPTYRVDAAKHGLSRRPAPIAVRVGSSTVEVEVLEGRLPGAGGPARAWLLDHPSFRRDGLYGEGGHDYPDNARRFALLSRGALSVARELGFVADVVHAHDWQAALALHFARGELPDARRILTIHNLAFQGLFDPAVIDEAGLDPRGYSPEGYEFWGRASFLKAGLVDADRITTVSPTYAEEIRTETFGCGLDGLLRRLAPRLSGVLNGVDYEAWNPARDPAIAAPYSIESLEGKRACKAALQGELSLPIAPRVPLVGAVARLTDQKGFDLAVETCEQLLPGREAQLVILGSGDPAIEARLRALAARLPRQVAIRIGYDEALARRIYAGADFFLMPSRWEPCGLGQLYALRYGTVPIVRATGGLEDTVSDYDPGARSGTGFKFDAATAAALDLALRRALTAYAQDEGFTALRRRGMHQDFSWTQAARRYRAVYESAGDTP